MKKIDPEKNSKNHLKTFVKFSFSIFWPETRFFHYSTCQKNLDLCTMVDFGRKWAKIIDLGEISASKWAKFGKICFSEKFGKTVENFPIVFGFSIFSPHTVFLGGSGGYTTGKVGKS